MQTDGGCCTRTHTATSHNNHLIVYCPSTHFLVYKLEEQQAATSALPLERTAMPAHARALARARRSDNASSADSPAAALSATWAEEDLKPSAWPLCTAKLAMQVCRVMVFESTMGHDAPLDAPAASTSETVLALDTANDRRDQTSIWNLSINVAYHRAKVLCKGFCVCEIAFGSSDHWRNAKISGLLWVLTHAAHAQASSWNCMQIVDAQPQPHDARVREEASNRKAPADSVAWPYMEAV